MDLTQFTQSGLIRPSELHALLHSEYAKNIKLFDATFFMPSDPKNARNEFTNAHIAGAEFFDIDHDFSDRSSPLPHMLCDAVTFEQNMSAMGVSYGDFIVIYGQTGVIMGPARAWWSFKAFGHNAVAVLDGGLPAWIRAGFPTISGKNLTPKPKAAYKAKVQPDLVKSLKQMHQALTDNTQILDARPAPRFTGAAAEPRSGLKSGHIPGSLNVPCAELVDPETGFFKSPPALRALFESKGYIAGKKTILTCGSGVTACALALALHNIGESDWSVYDGSWSEWGQNDLDNPIAIG
jgi:thiosulfate/3-mercaptopyruvate sulfurtransferase